jgi:hypothetical protein
VVYFCNLKNIFVKNEKKKLLCILYSFKKKKKRMLNQHCGTHTYNTSYAGSGDRRLKSWRLTQAIKETLSQKCKNKRAEGMTQGRVLVQSPVLGGKRGTNFVVSEW